jgi:hypothetical protein
VGAQRRQSASTSAGGSTLGRTRPLKAPPAAAAHLRMASPAALWKLPPSFSSATWKPWGARSGAAGRAGQRGRAATGCANSGVPRQRARQQPSAAWPAPRAVARRTARSWRRPASAPTAARGPTQAVGQPPHQGGVAGGASHTTRVGGGLRVAVVLVSRNLADVARARGVARDNGAAHLARHAVRQRVVGAKAAAVAGVALQARRANLAQHTRVGHRHEGRGERREDESGPHPGARRRLRAVPCG